MEKIVLRFYFGLGLDSFHARVLLDLGGETWQRVADFLHAVESIGKWPVAASGHLCFILAQAGDSDTHWTVGLCRYDGGNGAEQD